MHGYNFVQIEESVIGEHKENMETAVSNELCITVFEPTVFKSPQIEVERVGPGGQCGNSA